MMESIDKYRDTDPLHRQLQDLFSTLTEIAQRHGSDIPGGIFALDETQQQNLIDKLNPYVRFAFAEHPDLHGLPVQTSGAGMLYVSDLEGNALGAERITEADTVTGHINDVCLFPTPTVSCLAEASEETGIPCTDQILSPILVLNRSILKVGEEKEVDLANFQVHLPLAHYLQFTLQ